MITKVLRSAAWLLVLGAVVVTLGPQKIRPFTGVDHDLEHSLAFALIGLGYPRYRVALATLAVAAISLMEILQHWVPGRHANVRDFAVGACAGIAAGTLVDVLRRRRENG